MAKNLTRVTMIKMGESHIPTALKGFDAFAKTQQKNGKPYILSMECGPAYGHVRDQGFTLVAKATFSSAEDMKFYEAQCPAHQAYREFLAANAPATGLMTCIYTPGVSCKL
ncbi:hypothetical protein LTR62_002999 [Meristemomyces frigidus]|uniref:Stress-response A/B barrel domain-containing protein n=1 Tax=Meristemomyces frigidus TaxID=1508187 RepID=A0AAN7TJW0_9PEZI|nr:hypothetical protein LTR62_002999 [Meristemomyces frigidus]